MSTELTLPQQKHTLAKNVVDQIPRLMPLLHPGVHPNQWWAASVIAVNKLAPDVNEASVLISLANLAQTGLMLGDAMGHAYLVPYKGKCTLQFGYRGFLELGYGNRFLKGISVEHVLEGESTKLRHTERGKRFRHDLPDDLKRAVPSGENITGAYCTYETATGFCDVVIVPASELREIARKANESSPWKSNYAAMCLKTPIRRASKRWRLTKELAIAVELDEQAEREERQTLNGPSPFDQQLPTATSKAMLAATLEGKCGCATDDERSAVCKYVAPLAAPWKELDDAAARQILANLTEHTTRKEGAVKWADILPRALAN